MTTSVPDGQVEYPVELPVAEQGQASLRFLLMAGSSMPPDHVDDGEWERPLGWEQAAGAFQFYEAALTAAGRNFPPPYYWWQIIDLKTMTIIFRHDDAIRVLH